MSMGCPRCLHTGPSHLSWESSSLQFDLMTVLFRDHVDFNLYSPSSKLNLPSAASDGLMLLMLLVMANDASDFSDGLVLWLNAAS